VLHPPYFFKRLSNNAPLLGVRHKKNGQNKWGEHRGQHPTGGNSPHGREIAMSRRWLLGGGHKKTVTEQREKPMGGYPKKGRMAQTPPHKYTGMP
jgi:hypothetical protein